MREIFSLLLVFAICVTFCSCGSNANANGASPAEPAVKAETAAPAEDAAEDKTNNASLLVSSVPEAAVPQPGTAAPQSEPKAPAEPAAVAEQPKTAVTVRITMDNYQDYFEWVNNYTDEFDSNGAYKARTLKRSFALRQDLSLVEGATNEVSVSYTGKSAYRCGSGITFDFENMTFSGSPSMNDAYEEGGNPTVTNLTAGQSVFDTYKVFIVDPVGGNTVIDSYDIQILSISGTLTVYQ